MWNLLAFRIYHLDSPSVHHRSSGCGIFLVFGPSSVTNYTVMGHLQWISASREASRDALVQNLESTSVPGEIYCTAWNNHGTGKRPLDDNFRNSKEPSEIRCAGTQLQVVHWLPPVFSTLLEISKGHPDGLGI